MLATKPLDIRADHAEIIHKILEAEGTVFESINKESLINIKVVIPLQREIKRFEEMINLLDEKIYINSQQIQSHTRNCNQLLPRLMRDELRVRF